MKRIAVPKKTIEAVVTLSKSYSPEALMICAIIDELEKISNEELAEYYIQTKGYFDWILNVLITTEEEKTVVKIVRYIVALDQIRLGYNEQLKELNKK